MTPHGYHVTEEISQNEWLTLLRGRRLKDGGRVLLKVPRRTTPGRSEMGLLAREFELLSRLAIAGIPRRCEFHQADNSCSLVFEDLGGAPLHALVSSSGADLDSAFRIAANLASVLSDLHRQDIIHNGIHPKTILYNPQTGNVQFADLSLASHASNPVKPPIPAPALRGMLPYMSPEQTGRMNRLPDHRSDFYSLGVVLYELITGVHPYPSDDLLELVHWHIARTPRSPAQVDHRTPEVVSQVVMKLLAKTAEERYQSALGLRNDLETCANQWSGRRAIAPFPLGSRDISDRFLIPQKLYGREREIEDLLRAFHAATDGASAMMLVEGIPASARRPDSGTVQAHHPAARPLYRRQIRPDRTEHPLRRFDPSLPRAGAPVVDRERRAAGPMAEPDCARVGGKRRAYWPK